MSTRTIILAIDLIELSARLPVLAVINHLASALPLLLAQF